MKKIQVATCLLTAALIAASFAGCGETKSQTADSSSVKQEQPASQNERGSMAKIVSLDGDQLTVILADMPDGNGPAPSSDGGGQTPPSNDGNGQAPPSNDGSGPAPSSGSAVDSSGAPAGQPGQDSQGGQPGQGGGKIQFTGEQVTYTLSKDVKIAKGTGDNTAEISLSELAADDVISFTTTTGDDGGDVINSITVLDRVN